jgi:hypothetical protein
MSSNGNVGTSAGGKARPAVPIRGKGYSDQECFAICQAMIKAKNDPVRGPHSKLDDFHERFKKHFNKLQDGSWPDRQTSSLIEKYQAIRRDVAKFMGILDFVEKERPKSGNVQSEQGDVDKAMAGFFKTQGFVFAYYQCYTILKDQPMLGFKKKNPWAPMAAVQRLVAPAAGSGAASAFGGGGGVSGRDENVSNADDDWALPLLNDSFESEFLTEEWRNTSSTADAQPRQQQVQTDACEFNFI